MLLRHDPAIETPQKVGAMVHEGWVVYSREQHLFVKTFNHVPGAVYPDLGCCVELFTDARFLEVETLGPLVNLEPGEATEHIEHWFLFRGVPPAHDDTSVEGNVLPQVQWAKSF